MIQQRSREIKWFRDKLLRWFYDYGRKFPWRGKSLTTYQKIITEMLLQRTRAENVAKFYPSFMKRFPNWTELAIAEEEDLREFLQPIGLWRRRASSLRLLAEEMVKRKGRIPKTREEIECLPGVGQYIANSILLLCRGEPEPLMDVNMARVLERFFGPRKLADIRYDPYLQSLSRIVVKTKVPLTINYAILDFAALICKQPAPKCDICPLVRNCQFAVARLKLQNDVVL